MDKKRKIKVIFGINDFFVGGAQRQFSEQLRYFDRNQFEIVLVTLFQSADRSNLYHALPTNLEVHKLSFSGFTDIRNWSRLYKLLRALKPDIVVSSLFFSNTIFRVLKPFVGYISIAREHNTYIHKSTGEQWVDRILSRISYRIVAVSREVADFTSRQEKILRGKFEVIHNGVDVAHIEAELGQLPDRMLIRQELGFLPVEKIILNVGRLTPQKNQKLLIEAFALFHKSHPESRLVFVGDGSLREALEQQAVQCGVSSVVSFMGVHSAVWRFYKMADVLVSTSDIEGLSNVYLEALAAGLPIIVTHTAGTDEIIEEGKTGIILYERTPEAIVRGIEEGWKLMRCSAPIPSQEFRATFDIRKTVEKYEYLLEKAYATHDLT